MARAPRGSDAGELDSGIAARAGAFLEINFAGPSKDKRIARELGVSPSMAKMLRGGRGWTVARLDQLAARFAGFRDFVFPPPAAPPVGVDELAARLERVVQGLERLAEQIGALRAELREELRAGTDALRAEFTGGLAALRTDLQNLAR